MGIDLFLQLWRETALNDISQIFLDKLAVHIFLPLYTFDTQT